MEKIIKKLKPYKSIRLVGSNAREEENPSDIDFVTIMPTRELEKTLQANFGDVQLLKRGSIFRQYSISDIKVDFWKTTRYRFDYVTTYRTLPKHYLIYIKKLAREHKQKITSKGMYDLKTHGHELDWKRIMRLLWITSPNIISYLKPKTK